MPKLITGEESKQGSDEWLKFRRWRIGASEVAAILGISPFQTSLQLFEAKILDERTPPNKHMVRGSQMESSALAWFNESHAIAGLRYKPAVYTHSEYAWMVASLDGCIPSSPPMICEIKCPGTDAHMMALSGKVPPYYMPQLQAQMWVMETKSMKYVSFDGSEGVVLTVNYDEEYAQKTMIPAIFRFYRDLIDFSPPEPSDRDIITIVDPWALKTATRYCELKEKIRELETEMDLCKKEILKQVNHSRSIVGPLKICKTISKGRVDYSKIEVLKGLNLDPYRGESITSWRFSN